MCSLTLLPRPISDITVDSIPYQTFALSSSNCIWTISRTFEDRSIAPFDRRPGRRVVVRL